MTDRIYPRPRRDEIRALARFQGPVMTLTGPVSGSKGDAREIALRHRQIVSRGLDRWREVGAGEAGLERARAALSDFADTSAPSAQSVESHALIWSATEGLRMFGLPFECPEVARVASCAALRPLVRAADQPGRFRVLSFSVNRVALYEGDEDCLVHTEAESVPDSLVSALGAELTDSSLQFHTAGGGQESPIYHGHGGASKAREADLVRFYQSVARGLERELGDDPIPLVLASDAQHRHGLEQALSRDIGLLPKQYEGNPDHLSESALHTATWPIVADSVEVPGGSSGQSDRLAVRKLSEVVSHAVMGRIRRLAVPEKSTIPGRIDRDTGRAVEGWGDDDLIDDLVAEVLRRGGAIDVVEGESFSADSDTVSAELW